MIKKYKKLNLLPGDKIEIVINDKIEKGIFLESYDKRILLLKLENGYNIGLKKENISKIKILKRVREKKTKVFQLKLDDKKPIIDLIICGGTISSKLDYKSGGVKDLTEINEFFKTYPEIFEKANIRIKSPFMKASENIGALEWIKLAKIVGKSLNNPEVKGVIITHGTDFLHYTGSALSFMLGKLNKPDVLTYSQRSSDRGSSDARLNLICSAEIALSDIAEVTLVGHATINDNYCHVLQANKCRKMHTSRRDAFKPINCEIIAKIWPDKIEMLRYDINKRNNQKVIVDAVFNEKIALIKFSPCCDPKILDFYLKNNYKGIVIEMSGLGHVSLEGKYNWESKLKEIIKKGMIVYAVPQTLYGRLNPYVYSPGRKLKEINVNYLEDILPETAFVKLGWILGHPQWRGSIITNEKMKQNISREFNTRLGKEFID